MGLLVTCDSGREYKAFDETIRLLEEVRGLVGGVGGHSGWCWSCSRRGGVWPLHALDGEMHHLAARGALEGPEPAVMNL